jgi:hypothetical protein
MIYYSERKYVQVMGRNTAYNTAKLTKEEGGGSSFYISQAY